MTARFFLGVGEAAIAPGFAMITGMFYKRDEQPFRYVSTDVKNLLIYCTINMFCLIIRMEPDLLIYMTESSQAAWFIGNSLANTLGSIIGYGIGKIPTTHLVSWQYNFLILGAITSGYALVLFCFLPDSPATAVFLKKNERIIALQRTIENQTGLLDGGKYKINQVWMALKDPQTWFLVTYTFCVNLCNGGITSVSLSTPLSTQLNFSQNAFTNQG